MREDGGFVTREVELREHSSGMIRDTTEGKINYLLVRDGPLYKRWAELMTRGASSKGKRNWTKAGDDPETAQDDLDRFREGADRHLAQWQFGDDDEDHAAAVIFNLNGAELVKEKMRDRGQAYTL